MTQEESIDNNILKAVALLLEQLQTLSDQEKWRLIESVQYHTKPEEVIEESNTTVVSDEQYHHSNLGYGTQY